ncbi:tyrosine-type recombinase/integrase [Thalassoglobus polymorphus]|uniref:Tyrosine recombinase XerC n=1 Tax=Thalassoglobus polymorphus TaxID=2527994 RepID=A0A517QTB8_9PLAN|nr:site-specific integrase [Thalassoglobus polymorphus]QDT34828.1 Tyrosine recombinase XerC [Thalassoglobus polymorphus]
MPRQPKYCLHKSTNQAFVRVNGKQIYLGPYDSPESREAYDREILHWRRIHDTTGKHSTTVGQLCLAFQQHADQFYVDENGKPTGEANNFRKSLKLLISMFRTVYCSEFGPVKLKAVRSELEKVHVRTQVNKSISRLKSVFRWGVENEMVPAEIVMALDCVKGLQKGRCDAKESEPILPVPDDDFAASLTCMTKKVSTICQLLVLTGARVSEVRRMRVGDIDTSGEVWLLRPGSHKNAWRGKDRTIFIGPKGQALLMPFIADAVQSHIFVFRPREENEPYTLRGLESSIRKACKRAKVGHWGPGRLRHNAATTINSEFGDIDASRVVLGHSEKSTTQIYAERDLQKAAEIILKVG